MNSNNNHDLTTELLNHLTTPVFICIFIMSLVSFIMPSHVAAFVHIRQPIDIPMRDVRPAPYNQTYLSADAYLPAATGSWPVILIQTPYNKETFKWAFLYEFSSDPLLKSRDYAFVVMDWRGSFTNTADKYTGCPTLGQDGYDTVEWIAKQTWCDGNMGTWGASALGKVQFATAEERPPHLRGCVPIVAHYREWYDSYYPGGVYYRNRNDFISSYYGGIGLVRDHPLRDGLWIFAEGSSGNPSLINVPMLHITGWYDHGLRVSIREMEAIEQDGGPNARGRQKLVIGPWSHCKVGQLQQGELEYPLALYVSSREALDFFDFYLRGTANGYDTRWRIQYYRLGDHTWQEHTIWPPDDSTDTIYYLHKNGTLSDTTPSSSIDYLTYTADPNDPVPTLWGAVLTEDLSSQGPGDIRSVENRSDVLTFTTAPTTEELRIEGNISATLWLQCNVVDTDCAVRLTHVYPDGRSMIVVDGIRRVSIQDGFAERVFLNPGTIYKVTVQLPPVALTIPAGHSLRVNIAPSNYDLFDLNPQDGSSFSDEAGSTAITGTIKLYLNSAYPSHILLPVIPSSPPKLLFPNGIFSLLLLMD